MKYLKIKWRNKELEAILVNKYNNYIELKLKSGYNIVLDDSEFEIVEEIELERKSPEIVQEDGEYSVILTGGTIMSKVDYNTGAVYPSLDLSSIIQKNSKKIFLSELKFSEAMKPKDWEEIAKLAYKELELEKKVIVLHGTDTMSYTSSAVAFAIRDFNKPVVFVGAQRSSDRPSSDQLLNLKAAFQVADSDIGESVITMHETIEDKYIAIIRAVRSRKSHSSRRDAFRAIGEGKIGRLNIEMNRIEIIEEYRKIKELGNFMGKFSNKVGMIYFYPGMEREILEIFVKKYQGLVIVGTGLGHIDPELIDILDKNKTIVMTTQTIEGRVNMNVYSTGRMLLEKGVLGNITDILPEIAYVKLSWIIGNNLEKEIYEKNIVGEISSKSIYSSGA